MESHPLRMRGLKQKWSMLYEYNDRVASFTDAWIETYVGLNVPHMMKSHPLRMRGLKQNRLIFAFAVTAGSKK